MGVDDSNYNISINRNDDGTIGANEKTGTGEDTRVVYHLFNDDTGYSQNFLMKNMTNEELAERDPSGFEVDEEVYVDFTDKDGNILEEGEAKFYIAILFAILFNPFIRSDK